MPCIGDWVLLVNEDRTKYNIEHSDDKIAGTSDFEFKKHVKKQVRQHAFNELKEIQTEHLKVKHINFDHLKFPQEYLCDNRFTNRLSSLLFNLRCQSVNGVKGNFSNLFKGNTQCQFKCFNKEDTQEHMLECHELGKYLDQYQKSLLKEVVYSDLFGSPTKQLKVTQVFRILLKIRERLFGKNQQPACHGNNSGPNN